jgi:transposase
MYLRTVRRKNRNGSTVAYYQLAHNERHHKTGRPVAKVIHNFGRADQLDREALVRLCRSIARVCGVEVIDPARDEDCERAGLPRDVKLKRTLEYGTVMATVVLWERIGIGKTIRRLSRSRNVPYDKALLAMVANRLCQPESKLGVWERWLDTVYMPECRTLKLRQMYEAMDILAEHSSEIEREIFFQVANLMNLTVDVIFYDTSTVSFMVDEEDELRRYGHAKEGFWAPQVVVALAVTREGLPVRSWVFPGNTSDFTTIETVKKDLRGWNLGRALFVADAGMNSAENRKELAKACGTYLLASRMRSVKEIGDEVLSAPGRYRKISENLFAKEVVVSTGKRYVLCFNPQEAKRQQEHRTEIVHLLEEELARHKDRDASRKWAVELLASRRFGPYLTVTDKGKLRIDRKAVQGAKRYDGKWVVETNDPTLTVEDAATGYRSLMVIERCFRSLKRTQLKIMPVYHWLPRRIEAHVKICVLALLLERMMERQAGKPWTRIRSILSRIQATEFVASDHVFYQLNELPREAVSLLKSLGIPRPKRVFGIQELQKTGAMA